MDRLWFKRFGSKRGGCAAVACVLQLVVGASAVAMPLRLLPLGDSITWGWGSESTYGYRQPLADMLTGINVSHEFVGTIADDLQFNGTQFIDPAVRELVGSPLHYSIPGASADRLWQTNKGSLLWSLRNDSDGDGNADNAFANAGGLFPTLVSQGKAPDAILLHIGTNDFGFGLTAVTPNPGSYSDNAADSQLFRLLSGLGSDLAGSGLLSGSTDDTKILLARVIPRSVNSRTKPRGAPGTVGIDQQVLDQSIAYNAAIDAVVASLSSDMQQAIHIVDMFDVDLTSPILSPNPYRDDAVVDQPFDTLIGGDAVFNEQGQQVNGVLIDEADANGPDYADWLLRHDEKSGAFYDDALTDNDLRWNQGLYGTFHNGEYYDAIHPNINGYGLMARVWQAGLLDMGLITLPLPGDFNGSGQVEQGDLDLVLQNWGEDTDATGIPSGWTHDNDQLGQIEQTELDRVLQNWGGTNAPDFQEFIVPEPGTVWVAGLVLLVRARRRREAVG